MPGSKSAMKRVLTSEKAKIRNKSRKTALKTAEKKFRGFVESADLIKAKEVLSEIFSKLDKAVKVGTIHGNKRDRKKSRLVALISDKETVKGE